MRREFKLSATSDGRVVVMGAGNIPERPQQGVTLIIVSLVDAAVEGRLWIQAGTVMLIVLVLSRLALLAYGVALVRHQGGGS